MLFQLGLLVRPWAADATNVDTSSTPAAAAFRITTTPHFPFGSCPCDSFGPSAVIPGDDLHMLDLVAAHSRQIWGKLQGSYHHSWSV